MKPQKQGFILNRSSGSSREYESASDWGWWEQMITQASRQNRKHFERYITTDERTLLDRQSSVIRAQYDIAKHELLSNSSISVVQNIDIKLKNNGKHHSEKPKGILGNLKVMNASAKRTRGGSKMLNECCSYCNLTTAHINELNKGRRHRLGVAHNIERTGYVELSSRSSAIPRYKVDKHKPERAERLKAKPVHSDTMNSNLTGELQTVMIKLRPEKAQLVKYSSIFDKKMYKSNKVENKYHQNASAELKNLQIRQDYLEHKVKCLAPSPHAPELSEIELNNSKYDSWYNCRLSHQEGYKLISLQKIPIHKKYDHKAGAASEVEVDPRPPDNNITSKYRETVQKPKRKKWKLRYSERKERTETRRRIVINNAKSLDSVENSTLREENTNYNKNNVIRQAAGIKSSLALNIKYNKNNDISIRLLKESQPQTQLRGISKANLELLATETWNEGNALKRCSCELQLPTNQSESESMIVNVLNPTKKNADLKLLSSLFESNDFVVKSDQLESASTKTDSNKFTSMLVLKAISKEAQTCINIKEDNYMSASSNLQVKPAIPNLREISKKSMINKKSEVSSSKDYQSQEAVHLSDRSTNANHKTIQKILCINDSPSTIRNVCKEQRGNIFTNNVLPSMIHISSLSLLHSQQLRKMPRMVASIESDIKTSSNLFNLKNISAVSFILSSVTISDNIRPPVCRRNRMIIPNSMDTLAYLEIPKTQPIDSVLKSSSKISLFQSGSISNFRRIQQQKELLIRNTLSSVSNTSTGCHARANNALVYLDSQNELSISRSNLLRNIEITQSKEKQERFDEIQTLRKSPGKNALGKQATHSQFNRSFCTMNLRIPDKGITCTKHTRNKNKHVEEEPRLSVLYQKDLSILPKNRTKTDSQVNYTSKITQRSARKELSRVIKPSKSQKYISSNLRKLKIQKNDRARVSKYTIHKKSLIQTGFAAGHKQESQTKLVRRNRIKSSVKRLSPNWVPMSSQKVTQMGTNSSFNTEISKDNKSWPTSYPITSRSKNLSHIQRKNLTINNENELMPSQTCKMIHQNGEESEVSVPAKTSDVKSQTQLRAHNNKLNTRNLFPTLNSKLGTNKGWKIVINKCIKTIKSMTTKKASIAVNTNMSASHCYKKCKQWEQNCDFCTEALDAPKVNKLSTVSKRISNVECADYNDDDIFLKRCSGTINFRKDGKVQNTSKINDTYKQTVSNKNSPEFKGPAKIIYQNPDTYVYRTCDSYKCNKQSTKKRIILGTDNSNMSPVSSITTHDIPLYKSKSAQSNDISKRQSVVPGNTKSYEIETIFPLTCSKFYKSRSEIIKENSNIKYQNADESNIPNSFQGIQFYSVSNKKRPVKKIKEPNINKVKPMVSKGYEYAVKSSYSNPTNFKSFVIRFTTLFSRNQKTKANAKSLEANSVVNVLNSKHFNKVAKPSFKSLKQHCKHIKVEDYFKKSKKHRQHKESVCLSRSEKFKNIKMVKERRKVKLDKRHLQESLQSRENDSSHRLRDVNSISLKKSNKQAFSRPSYCYRHESLCCGHAQIQPNKVVNKSRVRLLRESLNNNLEPRRLLYLSDKPLPKKYMNFKKINCQIIKKDVGINCIRKKRFKTKTKCVQAELWDEKTVLMMSGDRKSDYKLQCRTNDRMISPRNKLEPIEINQRKCGRMMFDIQKIEANDNLLRNKKDYVTKRYKKEYVSMEPNDKNQMKVMHTIKTKIKNFLKINKPKIEQAFDETHPCNRYVDCEAKNKVQMKKMKHLGVDNASKVKYTQTPKVKEAKFTKSAKLARTAVKALQVDGEKHLKVCKVNQIKLAIKPKELITLPFKCDGKKNEATICDKIKQKNKYVKTADVDPFIRCKSTSTDNLIGAMTPVKQKTVKNAARVKKTLSSQPSVNRENDISTYLCNSMKTGVRRAKHKHRKNNKNSMEALLLQEPAMTGDVDFFPLCAPTSKTKKIGSKTNKQKNEKTEVKAKKGLLQKPAKTRDSEVFSVPTTNSPKKVTAKTFAKRKRKTNNAKTKPPFLLNKAVMTQNILVSSCCTNTTPSINKKIGTKIFSRHKKALPSNKAVEIKGVYVSSRSTNTTTSHDKKVEAKIYVKKRQDNNAPNTKTALSYPRTQTTKANRAGISVKVKREKNIDHRKQLHSDFSNSKCGKPFIKGTQPKMKCKTKQINTQQGEIVVNKGKTKIYTTEDKQTSASSKCMPRLSTEVPVTYSTMMSTNRTKQICCALFTAGAWHNSRAAISRSNQASTTYNDKPLTKNLQVMATHGVTCNMEKQRNSRKSKYVNAVAKGNGKERKKGLKIPLSKSNPCSICGNAICEECKVKFIKTSTEKGQIDKKSVNLKNKGEIFSKKNNAFKFNSKPITLHNVNAKVVRTDAVDTIQRKNKEKKEARKDEKLSKRKNKSAAKQAREMEKLNKRKNKYAAKQAREMEILNKRKHKYSEKEAKKMGKLNKRKNKSIPKDKNKVKIIKVKNQSVKKDRPQKKDDKKSKRKIKSIQKQTLRTKNSVKDARVMSIRIPFAFLNCSSRTQKRNPSILECEKLYKTTFRRRMILFIHVKRCCYFLRSTFRRLIGCLFFALGVIVWTPCICCFECCRECIFCCCSSCK